MWRNVCERRRTEAVFTKGTLWSLSGCSQASEVGADIEKLKGGAGVRGFMEVGGGGPPAETHLSASTSLHRNEAQQSNTALEQAWKP